MSKSIRMNPWLAALLAAASLAQADSRTTVRHTDRVTVREPDPQVRVTTDVDETVVRTRDDNGRWETTTAGSQTRTTIDDGGGEWTEYGWESDLRLQQDTKIRTRTQIGNATSRQMGRARLDEPETTMTGRVGPQFRESVRGEYGTASARADMGAEGSIRAGENGYEARGQVGIETEVRATSRRMSVGTRNAGASLQGSGKLEASVLARGRLGAYVDERGITFGAEGSAGVYVRGELRMNMEAHLFGVRTNVNVVASGYAGALAEGAAVVTLGWNGRVSFTANLGASLGFGGGVSVQFEVDAEELMERLNLPDIQTLLIWLKEFQENPAPMLARLGIQAIRLLHEAGFGALAKLGQDAARVFEHKVLAPIQRLGGNMREGVAQGLAFMSRLIHARRAEPTMPAINACLDQIEANAAGLADGSRRRNGLAFPLLASDGGALTPDQYDENDPYSWYLFNWPAPFSWPSL